MVSGAETPALLFVLRKDPNGEVDVCGLAGIASDKQYPLLTKLPISPA